MVRKPPKPRPRVGTFRIVMNIICTWTGASAGVPEPPGDQAWYHLQAGSPAINAGIGGLGVTEDIEGVSRPQGGTPDIGATEDE